MKNLGGISVDILEDGENFQCIIGAKLKGVPKMAVAAAVASLITKITEYDSDFPEHLERAMELQQNGELELEDMEWNG